MIRIAAIPAALALMAAPVIASAAVYGTLGNFDVVNDTGTEAHGFEIDIEDPSFDHTKVSDTFGGPGRGFPTTVERYGAPHVTDLPGVGVRISYLATFSGGAWNVGTASGVYSTPGESCWTGGSSTYPNIPCDHFGVGTLGNPAQVTYHWLVDPSNSGLLTSVNASVPSVNLTPQPPSPGNPNPPVQAVAIAPPPEGGQQFGDAVWLKVYSHSIGERVQLEDLMQGNNKVPNNGEVETEWTLLQAGGGRDENIGGESPKNGDEAVVRRYEFYKYTGDYDPENHEALCNGNCDTPNFGGVNNLGNYLGAQMVGVNLSPVPEPQTYALLLIGLGGLGAVVRRKRTR